MKLKENFLILLIVGLCGPLLLGQSKANVQAVYVYHNVGLGKSYKVDFLFNETEGISLFSTLEKSSDSSFLDEDGIIKFNISLEDSMGQAFYQHAASQEIIFRDMVYENSHSRPVIVTESIPKFNWELQAEQMKISNLNCQKALLSFRGRNYVVWYSSEISTPFGPWKFYGLPGMIVQAYTDDHQIQFLLHEVKTAKEKEIIRPTHGSQISFQDYVAAKDQNLDEFIKKLKSKLPRGARVSVNTKQNHNIEKTFE